MAFTGNVEQWYTSGRLSSFSVAPSENVCNVAKEAFEAAIKQFPDNNQRGKNAAFVLKDATSLQEIQQVVAKSMQAYQDRAKSQKTVKWLQRTTKSIEYYSNVFDVFVPRHPEYVSLAWGAMKFLLTAATEHEKTMQILAKSIAQIAESLPRVRLSSELYPTPRMQIYLEDLYASILGFLIKAYDWYNEGRLSHFLHSFTRPLHRLYADLVDEIAAKSRSIDQLSSSATQAEVRDMHRMLAVVQSRSQLSDQKMDDILDKMAAYHAIQSSSLLDTNQRVSDLQISQMLTYLSDVPLEDPLKSLQHHLFFRNRRVQGNSSLTTTNSFWLSSRFQSLFSTEDSAVAVMKGSFACRHVLQDFCVDVIQHLRSSNIPTLWALKKAATPNNARTRFSGMDLLKYLIFQALQLNESLKTEKTMAWRCAQFQRVTTAAELFQLLLAALNGLGQQVYLVIDLETIEESLQSFDGFNIVSAFLQSFHASQLPNTRLKIIIVRYRANSSEMQLDSDAALAIVPVRAIGRGRQQGKEVRQKVKTAVRRGMMRRKN